MFWHGQREDWKGAGTEMSDPEDGNRGKNWRAKYLTIETFEKWKDNDFAHLAKKVAKIEGSLYVLIPLGIAILTLVVIIALRV